MLPLESDGGGAGLVAVPAFHYVLLDSKPDFLWNVKCLYIIIYCDLQESAGKEWWQFQLPDQSNNILAICVCFSSKMYACCKSKRWAMASKSRFLECFPTSFTVRVGEFPKSVLSRISSNRGSNKRPGVVPILVSCHTESGRWLRSTCQVSFDRIDTLVCL